MLELLIPDKKSFRMHELNITDVFYPPPKKKKKKTKQKKKVKM
jgi:hypothetical protein